MLFNKKNIMLVAADLSSTTLQLLGERLAYCLSSMADKSIYVGTYEQLKIRSNKNSPRKEDLLVCCSNQMLFDPEANPEIDHVVFISTSTDVKYGGGSTLDLMQIQIRKHYQELAVTCSDKKPTVSLAAISQQQIETSALILANVVINEVLRAERHRHKSWK